MEEFLNALGIFVVVVMAVIGLLAGWIAGTVAGRNRGLYMVLGLVGAFVIPFLVAALGVGALAAGGVIMILFVALIGAVVVLVVGKLLFDK